ncbi:DUF862-domain-containing protein [Tricholoma matsutake]|nr:DUF862-domain-containing protein [Tricholoma matsutake 945]
MAVPVQLYVYDLSNGMARQMSRQLTGRQTDGIWHTSVVVYGREIFYGQGIDVTLPGRSHHGAPLQVLDMGQTSIDEDTFNEYLTEMKEHYTADKYHLLDFNCNSFTNDCVGFLTGGSIPNYIKDLPTDFLSTPFGAALRPTIDAMYRRPSPGMPTPALPSLLSPSAAGVPNQQLAGSILQSVASRAQAQAQPATETLTAPMHAITNPASFNSFLRTHRAAVAFFTDANCGPCKMIEPVLESLAEDKGAQEGRSVAFAKIDIGVGMGGALAGQYGIKATPTFLFFLDGEKISELKGANAPELRTQVDLLLFQAYPPHPHTSLSLPAVETVSLNPILFSQVPALDTVLTKLSTFIDNAPLPSSTINSKAQVKQVLSGTVIPYLRARFALVTPQKQLPSATPAILTPWAQVTSVLTAALPPASLFPLVDLWRLALLDPAVGMWISSSSPSSSDPVKVFLDKCSTDPTAAQQRNYILTLLRLLSNVFSTPVLSRRLFAVYKASVTKDVLVPSLLNEDPAVRTAAASLAFNVAGWMQRGRAGRIGRAKEGMLENEEDEEWEVEMVSVIIEAIGREGNSEDVVHRLTATLALLLRFSPSYDTQLVPLLEVLQSREVLMHKIGKGEGGVVWGKKVKEVRRLVEEVAGKLCR